MVALLKELRPMFELLPKAKTAKIVRTVIDSMAKIPNTTDRQVALCLEYIEWCIRERRAFLRQRIQARLANLYFIGGKYQQSLALVAELANEVKKLDDKTLLVEIFLIESRIHHALRNLPKSKSSLTAARSISNSIYLGPLLQGEIDYQNGVLNTDEKDYRTAYSYFFEAFEGFVTLADPRALKCLKYMLLTKIMNKQGDEVATISNSKNALKYSGEEIESMKAIAKAYKTRSLQDFDAVQKQFSSQLHGDPLVKTHLQDLESSLLEQNLVRIIEPFSKVQIKHVAELINLPLPVIETKLSQMILDKKFKGILDQGAGELIVFDETFNNSTYDATLKSMESMNHVVDSLFRRTGELEA